MTSPNDPAGPEHDREQRLLDAVLALGTEAERSAFIASIADPSLRRRLEELAAVSAEADVFFEACPLDEVGPPRGAPLGDASGSVVAPAQVHGAGRYKLLEKIGEGGFGDVWMAEQREPVKRRVALKIIKAGMDSQQVVARFEAERQALAMMDHPNIARIFDAGTTGEPAGLPIAGGRPFFVMELVRGTKITDYCDQNQLPTRQRLDLFVRVCHAIQHAHQKGIIHRDIKPSNILVTVNDGVPVPKVIDFGIAKATQGDLTDKTVFTQFQQFIGTPAYISPEQAEMSSLDIDTRSDIYSLGVLLYELLVGQTPFDAKEMMKGGLDALRQIIREREPQRPSTKLNTLPGDAKTTAGKRRQTDAGKLVHQLQGDLDWIVMKCLEKDRTRRYATANGLAADLQRYLADEPVTARPPSATYRLLKTWRRNRLVFAAGLAVAAALIVGLAVSIGQAMRASRAEALASRRWIDSEAARKEAEAVTEFLTTIFKSPSPTQAGRHVTVAETLARAVQSLETSFAHQPAVRARLQSTLAETYLALGMPLEALPLQEDLRKHHLAEFGPDHPATLSALQSLAFTYRALGRKVESLSLLEHVVAGRTKLLGLDHPSTLSSMSLLARTRISLGQAREGRQMLEDVLERSRKVNGPNHRDTHATMQSLALFYSHLPNRQDDAIRLCREVVNHRREQLGVAHAETLQAMGLLADIYATAGRRAESSDLFEQVMPLLLEKFGLEHPVRMDVAAHLGRWSTDWAWADRGTNPIGAHRLATEGERILREMLPVFEAQTNTPAYHLACVRSRLGGALVVTAFTDPGLNPSTREPRLAEAEAMLLRAQSGIAGDADFCRRAALERLVRLYDAWGKPEKLAHWREELTAFDQTQARVGN